MGIRDFASSHSHIIVDELDRRNLRNESTSSFNSEEADVESDFD